MDVPYAPPNPYAFLLWDSVVAEPQNETVRRLVSEYRPKRVEIAEPSPVMLAPPSSVYSDTTDSECECGPGADTAACRFGVVLHDMVAAQAAFVARLSRCLEVYVSLLHGELYRDCVLVPVERLLFPRQLERIVDHTVGLYSAVAVQCSPSAMPGKRSISAVPLADALAAVAWRSSDLVDVLRCFVRVCAPVYAEYNASQTQRAAALATLQRSGPLLAQLWLRECRFLTKAELRAVLDAPVVHGAEIFPMLARLADASRGVLLQSDSAMLCELAVRWQAQPLSTAPPVPTSLLQATLPHHQMVARFRQQIRRIAVVRQAIELHLRQAVASSGTVCHMAQLWHQQLATPLSAAMVGLCVEVFELAQQYATDVSKSVVSALIIAESYCSGVIHLVNRQRRWEGSRVRLLHRAVLVPARSDRQTRQQNRLEHELPMLVALLDKFTAAATTELHRVTTEWLRRCATAVKPTRSGHVLSHVTR